MEDMPKPKLRKKVSTGNTTAVESNFPDNYIPIPVPQPEQVPLDSTGDNFRPITGLKKKAEGLKPSDRETGIIVGNEDDQIILESF